MSTVIKLEPFVIWRAGLRDRRAAALVDARIYRLQQGNAGDCKNLTGGLYELRLDYGKGLRVYWGRRGKELVLLLGGGDKSTQNRDIESARALLARIKAEGIEYGD